MRKHAGLAILTMLVFVCVPWGVTAGCPDTGATNVTCNRKASSIESCANRIWGDFLGIEMTTIGLQNSPPNPEERIARIRKIKAKLPEEIGTLGAARQYELGMPFKCSAENIEACETAMRFARNGATLLNRTELITGLPAATRERLKRTLLQHEAEYRAALDQSVAAYAGDPSNLCNESYASVVSCERAVAADSTALREQVFPEYACGERIPGKFLTIKDAEEEARRKDAPATERFEFEVAQRFTAERLQKETALLEKAKQAQ